MGMCCCVTVGWIYSIYFYFLRSAAEEEMKQSDSDGFQATKVKVDMVNMFKLP